MRSRALACSVMVVAGLAPGSVARAGGLVVAASDGQTSAQQLAPVAQVRIEAELGGARAVVTEERSYRSIAPLAVPVLEGRFYRSLVGPPGTRFEGATRMGEPLAGEVLEPDAADALRLELVRRLGQPSMLRELGTPMFVSEAFALEAGGDGASIRLTTSVPASERGTLLGVDVPLDWSPQDVGAVTIEVTAQTEAPLRALYSPYHGLTVSRQGAHAATASYRGSQVCSRFDVTLLWSVGDEDVRLDLLPFRYDDVDGGHLLALLTPPATAPQDRRQGRDIVLALDVSGSMQGEKLEQARAALGGVLSRLDEADRIALVTFQTEVEAFAAGVLPATADTVDDARAFVDGLEASGGTNIHGALERAIAALPGDETRPRYVVMLTDGQPTEGVTDVDAIVDLVAGGAAGARVFPFGIGYDVNTRLLDRLAGESGGQAIYVRPGESVADPVAAFFARIEDPVLTDPSFRFEGLGVARMHPAELPDLYAGETLAVLASYDAPGVGSARLQGYAARSDVEHVFDVALPEHALSAGFVPRIWALREVGALLSAIKLGDASAEVEKRLRAVAERYAVSTDFTGYEEDEDGDMWFVYSPVPLAETGAAAVEASASISGYTQGAAADAAGPTEVRYREDRAFVTRAGYYTDTTLAAAPSWVDLHFGSERYFELAARAPGASGMLAVAPAVRFEWLGHAYRVTDPATAEPDTLPAEVAKLPDPLRELDGDGLTLAIAVSEPTGAAGAEPGQPVRGSDAEPVRERDPEPEEHDESSASARAKHVSACSVVAPGTQGARGAFLVAFLAVLACVVAGRSRSADRSARVNRGARARWS